MEITQDEAIIYNRIIAIKDEIAKLNSSIKKLDKCIKIGRQEGLTDIELLPWIQKILDLKPKS